MAEAPKENGADPSVAVVAPADAVEDTVPGVGSLGGTASTSEVMPGLTSVAGDSSFLGVVCRIGCSSGTRSPLLGFIVESHAANSSGAPFGAPL